ncbi:unnamed protein product, partial [Medioppia subpectinata]
MNNRCESEEWLKQYQQMVSMMDTINTNDTPDTTAQDKPSQSADTSSAMIPDEETDLAVEALNQLNLGKRHLLVEDYSSAVMCLQESCQLFDQRFRIGAEECGEAYLYYGIALLELARLEDGLFDGVVHTKLADTETEDEEEEEADDEEEEEEAGNGKTEDKAEDKAEKSDDKKTDTEEDIEDSDEEKKKRLNAAKEADTESANVMQSSASADAPPECVASTSKGETSAAKDDDTEDEASNIEVAWEVLCLAKGVFEAFIEKNDNKLKLSETYQKLGEISIEWENNTNAIDLLNRCLTFRKEILSEDDRLIAETYYQLGIAHSFSSDIQNANNCFQSAIQVIETRIVNQKSRLATIPAEDLETTEKIKRELTQLESLLPEMRVKIEDSNDQMNNEKEGLQRQESE